MQWRNSDERYGAISVALHWSGAGAVLLMLTTATLMALAPGREAYLPLVKLHASIGITIALLLAIRIAWHFAARQPRKLSDQPALNRLAQVVHAALLVLIGCQLVTGPLDIWSGGFPFGWFGVATVPNPVPGLFKAQHDAIGTLHAWTGWTIAGLVGLHLAGVAKHLLIDRDGTLRRMLGQSPTEARQGPSRG
ncbi:cytochrome b [Sphingomonas sp.]|jgi:cytochrome b561|uniref:cytochrome b n=1 Tax=Sphingomonas sp. TaxID=28214 RepID=UPI002D7F35BB|nr:cytochrome b [Sphingomonas sp.]HEU0045404.1 cytochrome b [Sphingomonas sp.]